MTQISGANVELGRLHGSRQNQDLRPASPRLLPTRTPQEPERHPGVWPEGASASQPLCAVRLH